MLLEKRDWQTVFDHVSSVQDAHKVTIEVIREVFGIQKEVENLPFRGLSYDPRSSTLAVRAGAVEHVICHPAEMEISHADGAVFCLKVFGTDRSHHLISFVLRSICPILYCVNETAERRLGLAGLFLGPAPFKFLHEARHGRVFHVIQAKAMRFERPVTPHIIGGLQSPPRRAKIVGWILNRSRGPTSFPLFS